MLVSDRRRQIMVDTSDLKSSEFYFAVIQILRIAAEWIQESMDDLRQIVDDMERLYLSTAPDDKFNATFVSPSDIHGQGVEVFQRNWESVLREQRLLGTSLLVRIAKRTEEAKSLRDGVRPHNWEI
jgi:hypothetical protein